jgi:hypothetical protein
MLAFWVLNRIIHGGGFSSDEIKDYRPYIYQNAIYSLREILKAMPELGISFVNKELEVFHLSNFRRKSSRNRESEQFRIQSD